MKKLLAATLIAASALTTTGCTNPVTTGQYKAALEQIKNHPLEGFTLSETREPVAGIDYSNPNPSYVFTSESTDDQATFCTKLIPWAQKYGADSWLVDPEYVAMPIEGRESLAQMNCIGGNQFSIVGSTKDVRWWIQGSPQRIEISTVMSQEGGLDDQRMVSHTWDEAIKQINPDYKLRMDILSAVETYRLAHPKEDPSSVATITKAIANSEPKPTIVKDAKNKAHYLDVPAGDYMAQLCINITPYDEKYFLAPNPGEGFFLLFNPSDQPQIDEFAYSTTDPCQTK